jgi:hypothetical protein
VLDAVQPTSDLLLSAIKAWQPDPACLAAGEEYVDLALRSFAAAGLSDLSIIRRLLRCAGYALTHDDPPWPDEAMIAVARHAAFCGLPEQQIGRLLARLSTELPDCVRDPSEIASWVRAACQEFTP